jgi:hypothetical protein
MASDLTTEAVLLDARASVVDLVVRELARAKANLGYTDAGSSPSRALYERTKIDMLTALRSALVEMAGAEVVALVERGEGQTP